MAARHHKSKSRHDEHMGMERYERGPARSHSSMNDGSYAGESARRTQEMEDAGMIHEDRSAIANLPQNVMIKPYPKTGPYIPEMLDDTISGVDKQMDLDDRKRAATFMPKKV